MMMKPQKISKNTVIFADVPYPILPSVPYVWEQSISFTLVPGNCRCNESGELAAGSNTANLCQLPPTAVGGKESKCAKVAAFS